MSLKYQVALQVQIWLLNNKHDYIPKKHTFIVCAEDIRTIEQVL